MVSTNSLCVLWQKHSSGLYSQTVGDAFSISVPQDSRIVSTAGQVRNNTGTYTSSGSLQRDPGCPVMTRQPQSHGMASTARDLKQFILCLQDSADGHVCNSGKQGDADLRFTLPYNSAGAVGALSISWVDLGLIYAFLQLQSFPRRWFS